MYLRPCMKVAQMTCSHSHCMRVSLSMAHDPVVDLLRPFHPQCLGWFTLGYHLSDAPGRPTCIANLLSASGLVPLHLCHEDHVRPVLDRLLTSCPAAVALRPQPWASVTATILVLVPLLLPFLECLQHPPVFLRTPFLRSYPEVPQLR